MARSFLSSSALLCMLLAGCATYKKSTSSDYMTSQAYQQREELTESSFTSDEAVLSNEDIERILNGRITLPQSARLAILRLGDHNSWWSYGGAFGEASAAAVATFHEKLIPLERIHDVSGLPDILIPGKATIPRLREAAARYQSHLLLVYRSESASYSRDRWFKPGEVLSYCTVEAILLDVRTGIVPFTSTVSEDFQVPESRDDFSLRETARKAELMAFERAAGQVGDGLAAFLSAVQ